MATPTSSDWTDYLGVVLPPVAFALLVPVAIVGGISEKMRRREIPLDRAKALRDFIEERARAKPEMYRFYLNNRPEGRR